MEKECELVAWWQRQDSSRNKDAKKRRKVRRGADADQANAPQDAAGTGGNPAAAEQVTG